MYEVRTSRGIISTRNVFEAFRIARRRGIAFVIRDGVRYSVETGKPKSQEWQLV